MQNVITVSKTIRHNAERWTSRILRLGVWASAGLMITGLIFAAIFPSSVVPFLANPSLGHLAKALCSASFDPANLMFAGLVILMFTPVLRVVTAMIGFTVERDWRFVLVSLIVLILLVGEVTYSVFISQ